MAQYLNPFLGQMIKEIQNVLNAQNIEEITEFMQDLLEMIQMFKRPLLDQQQMVDLGNLCTQVLRFSESRKNIVYKDYKDEINDMDDEAKELFEEEYDEYSELMQTCMELQGFMLKLYKESTENLIINNNLQFYQRPIFEQKFATESEKLYCICMFCEVFEHSSQNIFNSAFVIVTQKFLQLTNIKNNDILQSIAYGFGLACLRASNEQFQPFYEQIAKFLLQLCEISFYDKTPYEDCRDVAINALGKLSIYQTTDDSHRIQLFQKFTTFLPLKGEPLEAQDCHLNFLKYLRSNPNDIAIQQNQACILKSLQDIKNLHFQHPELEIIEEQSIALLQQFLP